MDLKLETYEAKICLYTHLTAPKRDISCGSKNPLASSVWNHLQYQLVTSQSTGKIICVAVSLNGHNFKSFIALFRHKLSVSFEWSFKAIVQNFSFVLYIVHHDTGEWGIPLLNFW
jgi:ABC-type molybdate transport system ATPase subunit